MSTLLSFPGQGAQQTGMLHDFQFDAVTKNILEEACDVLGENVLQLDTEQALCSTRAVQLCLLIAGVASARQLLANQPGPEYTSGLSIGAYPAAVIAGALSFADALKLVSLRGRLMEEAYPKGYSMSAVQGLSLTEVEALIKPFQAQGAAIYLANINADNQHVLAGKNELLEVIADLVRKQGIGRVCRINITVPSHCELLDKQAGLLKREFLLASIQRPHIKYISGSTARMILDPDGICNDLAFNMCRIVNWKETMESAFERGVRLHIQLAPGSVLANLGLRVIPQAVNISYQNSHIKNLQKLMQKNLCRTL